MAASLPPFFSEYAPLSRVAVCPPRFYELREPINVIQRDHVDRGLQVVPERALENHAALVAALRSAGAEVLEIEPDPRFAYQINTRDAGLGTPRGLVVGAFRLPARQGEEVFLKEAVEAAGGAILGQIVGAALEGGDFVALDARRAAVGLGPRTEPVAIDQLRRLLGPEVELVGVPFAERFLHLDMIFNVIAERTALGCLKALPDEFIAYLHEARISVIPVDEEGVFRHGCNVLAVGGQRIISHAANERINTLLSSIGFEVSVVEVAELAKSGGGPRCLTLPLERAV